MMWVEPVASRFLIVTADDFGIGPETSRGILELALYGPVKAAVLLVTSPYAESAVAAWRDAGHPMELGWHPCLTLDRPILPCQFVPSLVDSDGKFWHLGQFIRRLSAGRIQIDEVERELEAQLRRFVDLVGHAPTCVNAHHHVQVFSAISHVLCELLKKCQPKPYLRRVQESRATLLRVPGARLKRIFLSTLGSRSARRQARAGLPGNDWLIGITDPPCVADVQFLSRWLSKVPGKIVELTCHPGFHDPTLMGRDCTASDGQLLRRVREFRLLADRAFADACRQLAFAVVSPAQLVACIHDHERSVA
jgi:predicted glycoside hydrolase/deacetylase ChbG (UPF0249 family)